MKNKVLSPRVLTVSVVILFAILACNIGSQAPTPIVPIQSIVASPTTSIAHVIYPIDVPVARTNHAGDQDSSTTAARHFAPGGDKFSADLFERPFNADTMDVYFPYLDIQDATTYADDVWIYMNIILKSPDKESHFPGEYAVEVDTNLDGRGDWLVVASALTSTQWTTDGVQAWQDANHDVGGRNPIFADNQSTGDGYETLVFDQGKGNDPDAAWTRISPQDANSVQIAFKKSLIGNSARYLLGAWTGSPDQLKPALFDFNDHFTTEQAGSPLQDLITYPIKQLSELDNTCRMSVGFEPKGTELGHLSYSSTETSGLS